MDGAARDNLQMTGDPRPCYPLRPLSLMTDLPGFCLMRLICSLSEAVMYPQSIPFHFNASVIVLLM